MKYLISDLFLTSDPINDDWDEEYSIEVKTSDDTLQLGRATVGGDTIYVYDNNRLPVGALPNLGGATISAPSDKVKVFMNEMLRKLAEKG